MPKKEELTSLIGRRVRQLRLDRRWTQSGLAKSLGLSQNRLSEIEHGKGSFTAEQLITILRTFNVPIDLFVPPQNAVSELQNALARLGARELVESSDILPSARLKEVIAVIRETLTGAESPRHIAALAPVLANHAGGLNFTKLYSDLAEIGLTGRLGWVVENTVAALREELKSRSLPASEQIRYRHALLSLEYFLSYFLKQKRVLKMLPSNEDILDPGIGSDETLNEVKKRRSPVSRDWNLVTAIQPEDFRRALEASRGAH